MVDMASTIFVISAGDVVYDRTTSRLYSGRKTCEYLFKRDHDFLFEMNVKKLIAGFNNHFCLLLFFSYCKTVRCWSLPYSSLKPVTPPLEGINIKFHFSFSIEIQVTTISGPSSEHFLASAKTKFDNSWHFSSRLPYSIVVPSYFTLLAFFCCSIKYDIVLS